MASSWNSQKRMVSSLDGTVHASGTKLIALFYTGINLLRGRTEYGDSIEDEWVIVHILRELTKKYPNLWVKVTDSDGEFLLVEAAATLPSWLEPDIADNRVRLSHMRRRKLLSNDSVRCGFTTASFVLSNLRA